jgi:hypothetical protein
MPHNPTPAVNSRYGAPMGRPSRLQGDVLPTDPPMTLQRIRINSGGYDSGGAYWGLGAPLYWFSNSEGDVTGFLRATSREAAKAKICEDYPQARFYR